MKRRKVLISILILILLFGGAVLFLFSRPLVVYVVPEVPRSLVDRFSYPSFYSDGNLSLHLSEKNLKHLASVHKPSLVIYSPLTMVDKAYGKTLQWGTADSGADISLVLNANTMWNDALDALGDRPIGLLSERFDSNCINLYNTLRENHPNLQRVVYDGRISNVNEKDVLEEMNAFYAILVPSPLGTEEALRETKSRIVVDEREAISFISMDRLLSAAIDWDRIVPQALAMEEGRLEAHYTLSVLH